MSAWALLHPVGPEPPRVYWLRRALLLAALVLVVVVVVVVATSGGGGSRPTAAGHTSPKPTPSATQTPTTVTGCGAGSLHVTAATDAVTYRGGALPRLSVEVRNVGSAPCRLRVESAARTWSVFSGTDQVWTTADCPRTGKHVLHRLPPGQAVTYGLIWDRARSVSGCTQEGTAALPGTYRLYVSVDGVRSPAAVFHLAG